jgi:hypothetical protein
MGKSVFLYRGAATEGGPYRIKPHLPLKPLIVVDIAGYT